MIIDCISDLHGHYPKLEGGDLLIVAGDLTARGTEPEYFRCFDWIYEQDYLKKVLIAGNHDTQMQEENYSGPLGVMKGAFDYLCDSGTEFSYHIDGFPEEDEGFLPSGKRSLKIWGSPWTKTFPGINPNCMAFTVDTEEELAEKWALIPDDIDILITHSPAFGMHDLIEDYETRKMINVGSPSLTRWIADHVDNLKLHICGHIHEGYGVWDVRDAQLKLDAKLSPIFVNASHVNENYNPINKPIRIIL